MYTPCDVSVAMVLVAQQAASEIISEKNCWPRVCDLATANNLAEFLENPAARFATRLITFFGMIPNFEPSQILPRLATLLRPRDFLLFSANLAPGKNYEKGVRKILPLYDNAQTRDWLLTFLFDLGVERNEGELHFKIEECPIVTGLKRVTAYFHFAKSRVLFVDQEKFLFQPGETIRLFFSYRYTPKKTRQLLAAHGLATLDQWISKSGEEGIFHCQRA